MFLSLKNHTRATKTLSITVSVFLSTLPLTALLLKSFRLRLHTPYISVLWCKFEWLEMIIDLPLGFPINNIISLYQCCDAILNANSHLSNVIHCLEERPRTVTYGPFMGDMPKNARFASIKWTGAPVAVKPSYDLVLTCTTCQSKYAAGRICWLSSHGYSVL